MNSNQSENIKKKHFNWTKISINGNSFVFLLAEFMRHRLLDYIDISSYRNPIENWRGLSVLNPSIGSTKLMFLLNGKVAFLSVQTLRQKSELSIEQSAKKNVRNVTFLWMVLLIERCNECYACENFKDPITRNLIIASPSCVACFKERTKE